MAALYVMQEYGNELILHRYVLGRNLKYLKLLAFFYAYFGGIWNYIDTKFTWQVKSIIKYKHEIAAKTKIVHGLLYEYCIYSTHGVQVHTVGYRYQFREKKGFENPTL